MNSAKTIKEMEKGLKNVATRLNAAELNFIEVISNMGGISKTDAAKVLSVYRKLKLTKTDAVHGVISVKHGVYLEKDVIANALSM